jgi:hypothetical protein
MPRAWCAAHVLLDLDLDIEGVRVDAEPGGDAVARHRRDLAWLACLRRDVELRNSDEENFAVRFDLRTVHRPIATGDRPQARLTGLARGSRSVPSGA